MHVTDLTGDTALWQRLEAFDLDDPSATFPFSARLARENDWTPAYTQRVIAEYKRFVYLACVAGHPVTPSVDVDQVWHQHLAYTHSYWEEMCGIYHQERVGRQYATQSSNV